MIYLIDICINKLNLAPIDYYLLGLSSLQLAIKVIYKNIKKKKIIILLNYIFFLN